MDINHYLMKLIQMIQEMESLELFPAAVNMGKTEFRLIREIVAERDKGKDVSSSELARRLGVTRSAISQLVHKLEEKDVIKRVAKPGDRKVFYVRLSDRALALFEEQSKEADKFISRVVEEYGEEKINRLIKGYDELAACFRKLRAETEHAK